MDKAAAVITHSNSTHTSTRKSTHNSSNRPRGAEGVADMVYIAQGCQASGLACLVSVPAFPASLVEEAVVAEGAVGTDRTAQVVLADPVVREVREDREDPALRADLVVQEALVHRVVPGGREGLEGLDRRVARADLAHPEAREVLGGRESAVVVAAWAGSKTAPTICFPH